MQKKPVMIYLDPSIVQVMDEDAKLYGMTKSAYVSMMTVQFRMQQVGAKMVQSLKPEQIGKILQEESGI